MIAVVMSISIIFDVSEKLKDFMSPENNLTFLTIVSDYYPYFFIHYANLFSSLIIFLSVLWFTSFMAQRSEIIAILSNGVSFLRFSRPYIIASTFLLIISVVMNHYVAPFANKNRLDFVDLLEFPKIPKCSNLFFFQPLQYNKTRIGKIYNL